MKLRTIIVPLLAIAVQPLAAQDADSVVTLLFAGDIMGHDAQIAAAYNEIATVRNIKPQFLWFLIFLL